MARGSSQRSGPPPDPESLTQASGGWVLLPASGRPGEPPAWPLDQALERELDLWASEWARPQAIMWERCGQELEVALYVRAVVKAEKHDAPTNTRTLVRQLMEALGVSIPGMLRNRWKIEDTSAMADEFEDEDDDVRNRLTVVSGGAA
jgi:hypothetical protein